jgi:hypothetical protein
LHIVGYANDIEPQLESLGRIRPEAAVRLDVFVLLFHDEVAERPIVDRLRKHPHITALAVSPLHRLADASSYNLEAVKDTRSEDVFWHFCREKLSHLSTEAESRRGHRYGSEIWLRAGLLFSAPAFRQMQSLLLGTSADHSQIVWVHNGDHILDFVFGPKQAVRTFFGEFRIDFAERCLQQQSHERSARAEERNASSTKPLPLPLRTRWREDFCADPTQVRIVDLDACYSQHAAGSGLLVEQHHISLQYLAPLATGSNTLVYMSPSRTRGGDAVYAVCVAGFLRGFRFAFGAFHARITAATDGDVHYFFHVYYSPSNADDLAALRELQLFDAVKVLVAEPWSDRVERQILQDLPELGNRSLFTQLQYVSQARKVFLANRLRLEYQARFGIAYVGVVRSRPDLSLRLDLPIQDYVFPNTVSFGRCNNTAVCRVFDMFAIAPPEVMDVYARIYWRMPYCLALGMKSDCQCMPAHFDCMLLLMEERSIELNQVPEWREYRGWVFQDQRPSMELYPFLLIRTQTDVSQTSYLRNRFKSVGYASFRIFPSV